MIIVHDIRTVRAEGGITDIDVDVEWPGERGRYRFISDDRDEIGCLYSPSRDGVLPLAFHHAHGWASMEICKLVATAYAATR